MSDPFSRLLKELVAALPAPCGAVFIDWEGEAVGSAASDQSLRAAQEMGAHWGVVFRQALQALARAAVGPPLELMLRFADHRVVIWPVTEQYLLVVGCAPSTPMVQAAALIRATADQLRREM